MDVIDPSAAQQRTVRCTPDCTSLPTHANANGTHCLSVSTVYFAPFPHTRHLSHSTHLWYPLVLPPCSTAFNALALARTHQCNGWPYGAQCVQGPYHTYTLLQYCSHVARQRQHQLLWIALVISCRLALWLGCVSEGVLQPVPCGAYMATRCTCCGCTASPRPSCAQTCVCVCVSARVIWPQFCVASGWARNIHTTHTSKAEWVGAAVWRVCGHDAPCTTFYRHRLWLAR